MAVAASEVLRGNDRDSISGFGFYQQYLAMIVSKIGALDNLGNKRPQFERLVGSLVVEYKIYSRHFFILGNEKEAAKKEKERLKAIKLSRGERVSLICMLAGLFFLFCGANAIQTFFALFAAEILGKSSGEATSMLTIFAVSTAIGAIPAGLLGRKFGRKKTIVAGLLMFITAFVVYLVVDATTGNALTLVYVALVVGGFANMLITVNTLPLVLEIGGLDKVGTFTGYYYTATFSAQIATPIVYGIVRMLTGTYGSLFYYCPICFILSLICILFVKHGESEEITEDIIEEARLADD